MGKKAIDHDKYYEIKHSLEKHSIKQVVKYKGISVTTAKRVQRTASYVEYKALLHKEHPKQQGGKESSKTKTETTNKKSLFQRVFGR